MKTVLMIAFHYPPAGYSSGIQRTLKFSQYLAESGWRPVVLTAHPRAYRLSREDQLADIPSSVVVHRAFALDASRHLALFGRYPRFASLPDPWVSWWLGAVVSGLALLKKYRPRLIWSTYPIATAHLIAHTLHRRTQLPWVADFRDPMTEGDYPPDERQHQAYSEIESRTIHRADRCVFTTPGAVRMHAERYPEIDSDRLELVPNGYDEENFGEAEKLESQSPKRSGERPIVLVHSGTLYPSERDPRFLFAALSRLLAEGRISPSSLHIVLRAPGFEDHHRQLLMEHGIESIVSIEPGLPYRWALREMLDADGLLVLQASNCNQQVPAKIYEYLRSRRPILALTDPTGDTARVLRDAGIDSMEVLDDPHRIARALTRFLEGIRAGTAKIAGDDEVQRHSRRARAAALAGIFDDVVAG